MEEILQKYPRVPQANIERARLIWREEEEKVLRVIENPAKGKNMLRILTATTETQALFCYLLSVDLKRDLDEILAIPEHERDGKKMRNILDGMESATASTVRVARSAAVVNAIKLAQDAIEIDPDSQGGITKEFIKECKRLLKVMPTAKSSNEARTFS